MSFQKFGLHQRLLAALESANIKTPTPVQKQLIPRALDGKNLQVSAETGSGKTLAYLLPLMQLMNKPASSRSGSRALVLLPTRELALQTFKECDRLADFIKVKTALAIGGQESRYQASLLRRDPDIIVATPGRLIEHLNMGSAVLDDIELLVLDEADRMLDMGLRDQVFDITQRCIGKPQSILLSATLSHKGVSQLAQELLKDAEILNIANAQTRHQDITQKMLLSDSPEHKRKQLIWLLERTPFNKAVIFANKRSHVNKLVEWLHSMGFDANELHGEIPQDERKHIMSAFKQARFNILVATDVAARGLDIEGVELVINFDMAHSGDEYVHRIGRTGRAGNQGTAISLVSKPDWNLAASIQKYLKQSFEIMVIPGMSGQFKGLKKSKISNNSAKITASNQETKRHKTKKSMRTGWQKMSDDVKSGLAPPKRKPSK